MRHGTVFAAVAAAMLLFSTLLPPTAGAGEDQKDSEDLKASVKKAPEEAKQDGAQTWKKISESASDAAGKSQEAAKEAVKDAKEGWQEVKDAVKGKNRKPAPPSE
jgi:hypothetical protein